MRRWFTTTIAVIQCYTPGVTTPEQQLVCADGTAPDVTTGLCADGSQPQSQSFNATVLVLPRLNSNLSALTLLHLMSLPVCAQMVHNHNRSHSNATAPGVTTPEQQLVCADGTAPDVTTGLCADGSQPQSQSFNATAPGVTTPEQQLVCADGTAPDVTTGLCADGSQPQSPVA